MGKPTLYGADYSVYVRIARLALIAKGVDHTLVPLDIFAEGGPPAWYAELHPFHKIPAFDHDGFRLFETATIIRYVDEGFEGPALQPADARPRAAMNQIIGLLDAYAYRAMCGTSMSRPSRSRTREASPTLRSSKRPSPWPRRASPLWHG